MSEFSMGREYGWDDAIQNDSEFEVLPEGDYNFRIVKFERGRHPGSDKLPPCNKAILTVEISNGPRKATITHNLFLHSKCEGLLCEFFSSIGQRQHGERLVPRWNEIVGSTGTCKVGIDKWQGKNGEMTSNQIRKFYPKGRQIVEAPTAPAPAPAAQGYTTGVF